MSARPSFETASGCATPCCSLPAGFFRVRYFHGKQMRLADYVDEQRYHMGKMRFHNHRLHGVGILCGLKVCLPEPDGLVLRVGRGAALGPCGREIIVGWDQCVDVGAWFGQQKKVVRDTGHDPCKPDQDQRVRVCVVVRYAECSGGIEPAPKSCCGTTGSCGCGKGCGGTTCPDPCGDVAEYGRITEEFELRLMFADEAKDLAAHTLFPAAADIDNALAQAHGGVGLIESLAAPMRECCPGTEEDWLLLACFDLVIDKSDPEKVNAIVDIDHECASQVLLSTEVLQYLLAAVVADADLGTGGPEIQAIEFRKLAEHRYQFLLKLSAPIAPASLDVDSSFDLRRLSGRGWASPPSNAVTMAYKPRREDPSDVDGPTIYVDVDNSYEKFLKPGGRYQLFTPSDAEPVVDDLLRPLRPRQLMWRFGIQQGYGGDLEMTTLTEKGHGHD